MPVTQDDNQSGSSVIWDGTAYVTNPAITEGPTAPTADELHAREAARAAHAASMGITLRVPYAGPLDSDRR